ncbi:MAG: MBOAT family O-acyltransferase, partial [Oscillospiraceae bacterium]
IAQVALYISFFPQLIAGPIVRYTDVAEDMNDRRESLDDAAEGAARFIFGLGKKCVLSNALAELADSAFACPEGELSTALAWLGIIAYALHIYYDFSGYSDMAIGLGKLFGFRLPENFNYPYISASVTEFWRRWHMTLSGWFRDYLYIPLGGSRRSTARNILNLLIVWACTGLWHGADWNFLIWGLWYGLPDRQSAMSGAAPSPAARGAEACADAAGRHAGLGLVPRIRPEGGAGLLCRALFRPALVGRGDLLALRALAGTAARRHPRCARISGAQKAAGALELFPRAGRVRPCRELSARRGLQPVHLFQVLRGCGAWKNV